MIVAFLLAVQSAPAAPPLAAPAAIDFDLARLPPAGAAGRGADSCRPREGEEILVCGYRRRDGDYPFAAMAGRFATGPLVAETGIGGGATARAYVDGVTFSNGTTSNRVMVGIRLPF
ncbi:MAG TPA: hypothetical protein VN231_10750 [Allosphingosinicella sp.]|nr:hypothetical protein [Allosphingosinicella sp.]